MLETIIPLVIFGYLFYRFFYLPNRKQKACLDANCDGLIEVSVTYSGDAIPKEDRDNWEGSFWEVLSPRKIHANLKITYKDGKGSSTERTIDVMKYGPWDGGAILWAYCYLREANRTFRTDRVLSCVDLDTGEIINDLAAWLDKKYEASPERAIEKVIDEAWDALRVLYYICKADGRLTQKERTVVREAIRSLNDHPEIDDKYIDGLFDSIDNTTLTGFKRAFGRLINTNTVLAGKVVAWAEKIIDTEQTISPAEQEALEYLRSRFLKGPKPTSKH